MTWTAPATNGGSPIIDYTVTATPSDKACTTNASTYGCAVTGLTNGAKYKVSVRASNSTRLGKPAKMTKVIPTAVETVPLSSLVPTCKPATCTGPTSQATCWPEPTLKGPTSPGPTSMGPTSTRALRVRPPIHQRHPHPGHG